MSAPEHPMFFLKATNSFLATGENIRRPATCDGKLVYEGEFGIVIGKTYANVSEVDVAAKFSAVLASYSCINDVTAVELLQAEATFDQWTRGRSFVTLGVFGPVMASGLALNGLVVGTVLNGYER
ncbi:MAG: fumarylacetoacetate hydrolase family protein, partial [Rhodospirillales bacterium]